MASRAYQLSQDLTAGGPLGRLLSVKNVGPKSIETLMASGVRDVAELKKLSPVSPLAMGLRSAQIDGVRRYVARTNR